MTPTGKLRADLTEAERERYRQLCAFTPSEREVFDARTGGDSITKIAMTLHVSERTVNRRIRAILDKIARV